MLGRLETVGPQVVGDQFALLVSNVVDYAIFMLDPTGCIFSRFWASVVITALRDETGLLRGFGKVMPT